MMRTKTALSLAFVALIAGFAVGRSTVPNIVIGADPDDFKARGLETEALAALGDCLAEPFARPPHVRAVSVVDELDLGSLGCHPRLG